MSKIDLDTVPSGHLATTNLNDNFTSIEDELNDKVLYRDNPDGEPNQMLNDLDMNSQRILNLPSATTGNEPVTYGQLLAAQSGITSITTLSEEQTASSDGQSLFTLSTITYTPGAKNLVVYRNGVKIPRSSYTETSTSSITLNAANATVVKTGDEFEFEVNQRDVDTDTYLASNVTYTPAGSGAVTTDVQTKLRESVSVKDFGAIGDGVTDDSAAVQAALDSLSTSGGTLYGAPGETYLINSDIAIDRSSARRGIIDLNGATLKIQNCGILFDGPSEFLTTSLSTEPARGDVKLDLASVTGVVKGDLIEIESPAYTQNTVNTLHYYVVTEVDGNDVYIDGNVVCDITNQQIIDSGTSGSITVKVFHPCEKLSIINGHIEVTDTAGTEIALRVRKHFEVFIDNISCSGQTRAQIELTYNCYDVCQNLRFTDFGYTDKDSGYTNIAGAPSGLSYGYGLSHARNYSSTVRDVVGEKGWHTTDAARGQMHIVYDNVQTHRNGYGLATHEGCWHVTWRNCELRGKDGILATRCAFPTAIGCKFIDTDVHGFSYGQECVEVRIKDCEFDIQTGTAPETTYYIVFRDTTAGEPGPGSLSTGYGRVFIMTGNTIFGPRQCSTGFASSTNKEGVLIIDNNYFFKSELSAVYCLTNSSICGNEFVDMNNQFGIFAIQIDSGTDLRIENNGDQGTYTTASGSALIYLSGTTANNSIIKNNTTVADCVRFASTMDVDVVQNNTADGRCLRGDGTQTVVNKINNAQRVADLTVTITNDVNSATLS